MLVEQAVASWPFALAAMFLTGLGVSGTYQLGTQWAAERLPDRVGTASTAVMASAWLGVGTWPWIAGLVIESVSYSAIVYVLIAGTLIGALAFSLTRQPNAETQMQ